MPGMNGQEPNDVNTSVPQDDTQEETPSADNTNPEDKPSASDAKTFDAEYVKSLRSDAAKRRTEAKKLKAELDALKAEKAQSDEEKAKEKGEWKTLHDAKALKVAELEQSLKQVKANAAKALLSERIRQEKINAGMPIDLVDTFTVDLSGVEVTVDVDDGFKLNGGELLSAAVKQTVERITSKFQPSTPQPKDPLVIDGRPGKSNMKPDLIGIGNFGADFANMHKRK